MNHPKVNMLLLHASIIAHANYLGYMNKSVTLQI